MIELAWFWLRHQPDSALSRWFQARAGAAKGRIRRIAIVALAGKLLVAFMALCHPRRGSRRRRVQGGPMTQPHSSEAERDGFAGSGRAATADQPPG